MTALVLAAAAGAAVALWPASSRRHVATSLVAPGRDRSHRRLPRPRPRSVRSRSTRTREELLDPTAVLALVEAVAPALQAGLPPAAALSVGLGRPSAGLPRPGSASAGTRLIEDVQRAAQQGAPVGPVWQAAAARTGSVHLQLLGAAWTLSESSGAPLADAMRTTAGVLRSAAAQERRLASAVAGARATMNLLSVLPVGGPLVALTLGIGPMELYATAASGLSLGVGVALAALGRWWVRRLVAVVARGPVVW